MKQTAFKELAAAFEKLEQTSSSIAMVDVLARLLPKLSPQEVKMTAYLLSGKVGPSFSAPEFGMGEKMVVRAVARSCGLPATSIQNRFSKSGDLGRVAAASLAHRASRISIGQVSATLREIAQTSGAGAQAVKIEKLAKLLLEVSPVEAKYIVRAILGTHRIGLAEMTFLHGLAKAFGRGRVDKEVLEQAYNVLSDIGEVAFRASRGGIASLGRVKPVPGVPVRMMLATRVEDLDEVPFHLKGDLFVEYKYDGERVQIHKDSRGGMKIFSRRLEDITHQYPEVIAHLRKSLRAREAIVEGEVVAVDPKRKKLLPFQVVMQRKRRHEIEQYQKQVPVALFLFDLLYLNGRNLLSAPLSQRKRLLESRMKADATARIGTYIRAEEMTAAEHYFHEAISQGAEGVVIKGASSPYQAGHRGWYWIKFKKEYEKELADTFDVVIVGALLGKGSRAGSYGSVLVAAFDPRKNKYYSFTKVGAGLTEKLLAGLPKLLKPYRITRKHRLVETNMKMDVWFEPVKVIEISGADLTISPVHTVARDVLKKGGIALRFPRLLRIRDDKTAEQATSVQEILSMYRQKARSTRSKKHA